MLLEKSRPGNKPGDFQITNCWIRIVLPYAVFALDVNDAGIITRTPPIARWCKGKNWRVVRDYYVRKGGTVKGYRNYV